MDFINKIMFYDVNMPILLPKYIIVSYDIFDELWVDLGGEG
jgi:hypothetical protein